MPGAAQRGGPAAQCLGLVDPPVRKCLRISERVRAFGAHKGPRGARPSQGIHAGKRWAVRPLAWLSPCPVREKLEQVTSRGFRTVRARNKRNSLLGSCTILEKSDKVQRFPTNECAYWLSISLLLPPRIPAVGSGDAARALPSRGFSRGQQSP